MPAHYEATFAIRPPDGAEPSTGPELVRQASELVMAETRPTAAGEPAPELETGAVGDIAYAIISGERRHSRHQERYVRLEVRLCAAAGAAYAQIRTRYLSAEPNGPTPETPAGPPRLLRALTDRFDCRQQISPVSAAPCRLTPEQAETFSREHIVNPDRTLPILVITDPETGRAAINPTEAARMLAGLAQVVHTDHNGIGAVPGIKRCHSGWAAFYWTPDQSGRSPRVRYYAPNGRTPAARELQRECLAQAPDTDFDARFVTARSEVILHRNRQLEARQQQPAPPPTDETETDELRRQSRKEQIRANYNAQRLRAAQDKIRELEDRIHTLTTEPEPTPAPEPVPAPAPEYGPPPVPPEAIPLSGTASDNVTIIGHAINLYRESMRRHIIDTLRQRHNPDRITQLLTGSVELNRHYTRQLAETDPHAFVDVTIFENVVDNCPQDFPDRRFGRLLAEIRRIRNLTAHPTPQGIPYDIAHDSIRTIRQALTAVGDTETAAGIAQLAPLLR